MVCGLPLVARHARLLGRLGWSRLRVVCDPAEREAIAAALARYPADRPIAVEVSCEAAGADAPEAPVELDACGVYGRERLEAARPGERLAPDVAVRGPRDAAAARRFLFSQIRKSVELDGAISYYVMRPIGRVLTRLLVDTRVSPNQVTVCALACGLSAAVLVGLGGSTRAAIAGLLYWLGGVIDHVDGELARLRLSSSKVGEWLDSMTDEASTFSLLVGLGVGLWRDGHGGGWAVVCIAAAALGASAVARIYVDLHRQGLPIDTAQFPWFFQSGDAGAPSLVSRVIGAAGWIVRRDANVTFTAVLLLVDRRAVAAAVIAAAAVFGFGLTAVHYAVVGRR